jgi:aspartyl-tRNA(Asn)/glutamyl-tRNA(Gln) amidotransferase subunit A
MQDPSASQSLPRLGCLWGTFSPSHETSDWGGVSAPKSTPAEITDKLNKEINAAFADPKIKARLTDLGDSLARPPSSATSSPRTLRNGALTSAEAYSWHKQWMKDGADKYDPRVIVRIRPGETMTAANYIELMKLREQFIRTINAAASGYDAMLMPTTPDTAPTIAEASKDDETYARLNLRMLRNPAIVNLFDGCALSVPCHEPGTAPVGMMIAGTQNTDRKILEVGLAVEEVVSKRNG